MVESIAIMEYLMARYGPTPLAPGSHDFNFHTYNSSSTSVKPALQLPSTLSSAPAILRRSPSERTGAPTRR
jgi:hypothetical protein